MTRQLLAACVVSLALSIAWVGCSSNSTSQSGNGGATSGGSSGGGSTSNGGCWCTGGSYGGSGGGLAGAGGTAPTGGAAGTGGTAPTGGAATDAGTSVGGAAPTGGAAIDAGTSVGGAAGGGAGGRGDGGPPEVGADVGSDTGSEYNPCPTTAGTACAILPLGDSITEGFGATGNVGGYRIELFRQAVTDGKNITFVGSLTNGPTTVANQTFPRKHEGHGGFTISTGNGIAGQITDSAMSSYHPHIVLLMIGTNDINGNIDVANAPTRLGNLIDEIAKDSPSTLIVVASIIPIANDGTNQKVQTYNAAIPGVVSKAVATGKHVKFVDNYAAFSADSAYKTKWMYDYLHPNDAGYVVLGQSWYKAIGALLPAGS